DDLRIEAVGAPERLGDLLCGGARRNADDRDQIAWLAQLDLLHDRRVSASLQALAQPIGLIATAERAKPYVEGLTILTLVAALTYRARFPTGIAAAAALQTRQANGTLRRLLPVAVAGRIIQRRVGRVVERPID